MSALAAGVMGWGKEDVRAWLARIGLERYSETLCDIHNMDGPALLMLQESDLRQPPLQMTVLGDIKRLVFHLAELRLDSPPLGSRALYCLAPKPSSSYSLASDSSPTRSQPHKEVRPESLSTTTSDEEGDLQSVPSGDAYPLARGERLALLCKACQTALRCLVINNSNRRGEIFLAGLQRATLQLPFLQSAGKQPWLSCKQMLLATCKNPTVDIL